MHQLVCFADVPVAVFSEEQIQRNMRHVAHAIAQQELEGLKVSPSTIADLERVAHDEIDSEEVIRRIYRRVGKEQPPLQDKLAPAKPLVIRAFPHAAPSMHYSGELGDCKTTNG